MHPPHQLIHALLRVMTAQGAVCCEHLPSEKASMDFVRRRRLRKPFAFVGRGLLPFPPAPPPRPEQQRGEEAHQRKPGGCGCVDVASAEIVDAALLKALARATLSKVCCVFVASF